MGDELLAEEEKVVARGVKAGSVRGPYRKTTQKIERFRVELNRALILAIDNDRSLPAEKFYTGREIRQRFGLSALVEFREWFSSEQSFDNDRADQILQAFRSGKINQRTYTSRINRCFKWRWRLKLGRVIDARSIVRPAVLEF